MPSAHPRPYHLPALFGPGLRVPMPAARLAVWKAMVRNDRRPRRLTVSAVQIAIALADILGPDGTLCPSHAFLAAQVHIDQSTVARSLNRLRDLGYVTWTRRLVRNGWRTEQTTNQYQLRLPELPVLDAEEKKPTWRLSRAFCGSQATPAAASCTSGALPFPIDLATAQAALAARRAVVEARLAAGK